MEGWRGEEWSGVMEGGGVREGGGYGVMEGGKQ